MVSLREQVLERLEAYKCEVQSAGEELRDLPLPALTEEEFGLYEKTGNRLIYEESYFGRRKALAVFGLLSLWYHREEDLKKLCEIIREVCEERTWALPAHVDRSMAGWERTVDLFACETGQTLAEIVTHLNGEIPEALAAEVKKQVVYRLIDSYLEQPFGTIRWEKFYNNWVAVCAGSLGSIAMYLLDDDPQKQMACLDRVVNTMPLYLEGMMDDGACPEGLSYFTYGMTYFTGFAEQLKEFSHGEIDLMDNPKVERIARFQQLCYLSGGCTISFSDGDRRDKFRLGLTCYLAMRYPGVKLPPMESVMELNEDSCYRFMALYRDAVWVEQYLESTGKPKAENRPGVTDAEAQNISENDWYAVLQDAEWAIGNSDNGVSMAIKGGNNGESHNHNDVGSFLYIKDGEIFLAELGCGEYTRQYFGAERYDILCNRSLGHSVPLVNGKEQLEGEEYCAGSFTAGCEGECGSAVISMEKAYPEGAIDGITRAAVFEKKSGRLLITDTFKMSGETREITENLVTQIEPQILDESTAILAGKCSTIYIRKKAGTGKWTSVKEIFSNHKGENEDVWLLQWKLPIEGDMVDCTIEAGVYNK